MSARWCSACSSSPPKDSRNGAAAAAKCSGAEEFWNRCDSQNRQAGLAQLWHARALMAEGEREQASEIGERALAVLDRTALAVDGPFVAQTRLELKPPRHSP